MSDEAEDVGIWLSKACPPKNFQTPGSCNRRTPKTLAKKFHSCKMKMNNFGGSLISAFLTQNSPPPPHLMTAKKQSTLTDFYSRHGKLLHEHQSNNSNKQTDNDGESSTSAEFEFVPEVLTDVPLPTVEAPSLNSPVSPNQTLPKQSRQDKFKLNLNESGKVQNDSCETSLLHANWCNAGVEKSNEHVDRYHNTKTVLEKRKILEDVMNLPSKKVKTVHSMELSSSNESVQLDYLNSKNDQNSLQVLNQPDEKWNIQDEASICLFEDSGDRSCFSGDCHVTGKRPDGKGRSCFSGDCNVTGKSPDGEELSSSLVLTESSSLDFSEGEVSVRTACLPPLSQDVQFKHRKEKYLLELGQLEFTENE